MSPYARVAALLYRAYVAEQTRAYSRPSMARRFSAGFLRRVRRLIVKAGDPVVRMRVGARDLELHMSHALPLHLACSPTYDRELPRIARLLREAGSSFSMIDVGANVGDTAALVTDAVPDAHLLCIEGSARYAELLRANVQRLGLDAVCVQAFCGDAASSPPMESDEDRGTGRLRQASAGFANVRTRTLDEIVAEHPQFARPALLKIDTDGFDQRVLRGARQLLVECLPVIFFELAVTLIRDVGDDPSTIFPMLAEMGYERARIYDHVGIAAGTFDLMDPSLFGAAKTASRVGDAHYCDVLVWPTRWRAILEPSSVDERKQR
jgi:FkbM family methyltransferase